MIDLSEQREGVGAGRRIHLNAECGGIRRGRQIGDVSGCVERIGARIPEILQRDVAGLDGHTAGIEHRQPAEWREANRRRRIGARVELQRSGGRHGRRIGQIVASSNIAVAGERARQIVLVHIGRGARRNRRTVIVEADVAAEIDERASGDGVAIAVGNGHRLGQSHQIAGKLGNVIGERRTRGCRVGRQVIDLLELGQRDHARAIDRQREDGVARIDAAFGRCSRSGDDTAAVDIEPDPDITDGQTGRRSFADRKAQRIARGGCSRAVRAVGRCRREYAAERCGRNVAVASDGVGVLGLDKEGGAVGRDDAEARTVVLKHDRVADVECTADRVAVVIGDRHGYGDRVVDDPLLRGQRIVRRCVVDVLAGIVVLVEIATVIVFDCDVLNDGDPAGGRIDVDRECRRIAGANRTAARVITADDQRIIDLEQRNRTIARGRAQSAAGAVAIIEIKRKDSRSRTIRAIVRRDVDDRPRALRVGRRANERRTCSGRTRIGDACERIRRRRRNIVIVQVARGRSGRQRGILQTGGFIDDDNLARLQGKSRFRTVVIDIDLQGTAGEVAVAVGDAIIDRELDIVLGAAAVVRMIDRVGLNDAVGARRRIDGDLEHQNGLAVLNLADRNLVVGNHARKIEAGRQADSGQNRTAGAVDAVVVAQNSCRILRSIVIVRAAVDAVGTRYVVILKHHRAVRADRRAVIQERNAIADVHGIRRLVAIGIGHGQRGDNLARQRLLNRQRIVRQGIVDVVAVIVGLVRIATVVVPDGEVLRDADAPV